MPGIGTDLSGNPTGPITPFLTGENVAAAGTVIANATALGGVGLSVVSGANDAAGVILPAASRGAVKYVYSSQATNGLKIYPPVNGTINGGSANAAINIEGLTVAQFIGTSGTNWASAFTVNA